MISTTASTRCVIHIRCLIFQQGTGWVEVHTRASQNHVHQTGKSPSSTDRAYELASDVGHPFRQPQHNVRFSLSSPRNHLFRSPGKFPRHSTGRWPSYANTSSDTGQEESDCEAQKIIFTTGSGSRVRHVMDSPNSMPRALPKGRGASSIVDSHVIVLQGQYSITSS